MDNAPRRLPLRDRQRYLNIILRHAVAEQKAKPGGHLLLTPGQIAAIKKGVRR